MRGEVTKFSDFSGKGEITANGMTAPLPFKISSDEKDILAKGMMVDFTEANNNGAPFADNVKIVYKHYLPKDTLGLLLSLGGAKVDNSALMVEKYIRAPKHRRIADNKIGEGKFTRCFSEIEKKLIKAIREVQNDLLHPLYGHTFIGELKSRMVTGLGSASVFETGIILHKPYGFPYIPGSGIKGAFRSFLTSGYSEEYGAESLEFLFGTNEPNPRKGILVFFDAYPTIEDAEKDRLELELDIMTPHFKDWHETASDKLYKKITNPNGTTRKIEIAPTDDKDPVPIKFLTVPAGTKFTFRIGGMERLDYCGLRNDLKEKFKEMLEYAGLGAKTAVGYGWFQEPENTEDA